MAVGHYTEQRDAKLYNQPLFDTSTVPRHRIGTTRSLDDGRSFVYAKAGANISAGTLCQAPAVVANHRNLSVANASAGDKRVYVTLGATALSADAYKDGFLFINAGTGAGQMYKIRGHKAIASSGSGWIELYDSLRTALASANSKASLFPNPFNGVVAYNTSSPTSVVGVTPISVNSGDYFWIQVSGPASVLTNGTLVAGYNCIAGGANGAVTPLPGTYSASIQIVGRVLVVSATTEYSLVWLDIPSVC